MKMSNINIFYAIINTFLASWTITKMRPFEMIYNSLKDTKYPLISIIANISLYISTFQPLWCIFCCSFWLSLIVYHNILLSCGIAFITFWYSKLFSHIEERIKI